MVWLKLIQQRCTDTAMGYRYDIIQIRRRDKFENLRIRYIGDIAKQICFMHILYIIYNFKKSRTLDEWFIHSNKLT